MGCGTSVDLSTTPMGVSLPSSQLNGGPGGHEHYGVGGPISSSMNRGRTPSTPQHRQGQGGDARKRILLETLEAEGLMGPYSHRLQHQSSFKLPPISTHANGAIGSVHGTSGIGGDKNMSELKVRANSISLTGAQIVSGSGTTIASTQIDPPTHSSNTTTLAYQRDHSQQFDHSVGGGDHLYVEKSQQLQEKSQQHQEKSQQHHLYVEKSSKSNTNSNTLQPTKFMLPRIGSSSATVTNSTTPNLLPTATPTPTIKYDENGPPIFVRHNSMSRSSVSSREDGGPDENNNHSNPDLPRPKAVKPGHRLPAVEGAKILTPADPTSSTPQPPALFQQQPQKSHLSPVFAANSSSFLPPKSSSTPRVIPQPTTPADSTVEEKVVVGETTANFSPSNSSIRYSPPPPMPQQEQQHPLPTPTIQPDVIPLQDVETYAKIYYMYSENVPEYRDYKSLWEAEQTRYRLEREAKEAAAAKGPGHLKSRSIYSPEPSHESGYEDSPIPSGVASPIPGGQFIADGTALCLLIETSRPNSICPSPIPNYKIAYNPSPISPSLYALGGDKSITPFPGSPNPLSPALTHRSDQDHLDLPYDAISPTSRTTGGTSPQQLSRRETTAAALLTQHRKAAAACLAATSVPTALPIRASSDLPHLVYDAHRRTSSQPQLTPSAGPIVATLSSNPVQEIKMTMPPPRQPILPGTAHHAVDWTRLQSQLSRLAEESESENLSGDGLGPVDLNAPPCQPLPPVPASTTAPSTTANNTPSPLPNLSTFAMRHHHHSFSPPKEQVPEGNTPELLQPSPAAIFSTNNPVTTTTIPPPSSSPSVPITAATISPKESPVKAASVTPAVAIRSIVDAAHTRSSGMPISSTNGPIVGHHTASVQPLPSPPRNVGPLPSPTKRVSSAERLRGILG